MDACSSSANSVHTAAATGLGAGATWAAQPSVGVAAALVDMDSLKPAAEFAKFLAVAKRGKAATGFDANNRDQQRGELERSIRFLRETIGLGTKA
jgi:hypothetical protein